MSKTKTPPNPLLDHKPRRLMAGGTPTVFVNNKMLNADQLNPSGLTAAVGAD